jgi:superfamily II DNA helicase RecQ
MEIAATLMLRSPLVICGSVARPNLHISVRRKPSEDTSMAASMLVDVILGKPCRLLPNPQPFESTFGPSGNIRPTIIYCVSRSEVEQLCSYMNADERLRGKACCLSYLAMHAKCVFMYCVGSVSQVFDQDKVFISASCVATGGSILCSNVS